MWDELITDSNWKCDSFQTRGSFPYDALAAETRFSCSCFSSLIASRWSLHREINILQLFLRRTLLRQEL